MRKLSFNSKDTWPQEVKSALTTLNGMPLPSWFNRMRDIMNCRDDEMDAMRISRQERPPTPPEVSKDISKCPSTLAHNIFQNHLTLAIHSHNAPNFNSKGATRHELLTKAGRY